MVTAIASQKGGTGKTTTSISLSAGLARQGKKVLLVDTDSQANSSKVLLSDRFAQLRKQETLYPTIIDRQTLVIHPTSVPNLDVVPSHILLSDTDVVLTTAKDHREARLRTALDRVKGQYDYVFIDCPPALGWLTLNALTAADTVLVVVSPGYFELDSIVQISKTIAEVQELYNPGLRLLGLLFTMSEPTNNAKTSLQVLRQTYPELLVKTIIPRNTDLKDAHLAKQDIFAYSPRSIGAKGYERLMDELFV
jgi:chromosome partitioning protein